MTFHKRKTKQSLTASIPFTDVEPHTHNQSLQIHHWRQFMSSEIDAQLANHTWDLVPYSEHMNIVDTTWIFWIKQLPDGSLDKYKSRLVASGFNQQQGVDFEETYSPIIKSSTIRLILKIAVSKDWCLRQLDVNNAFLQETLNEDVYVRQPLGFIDANQPNHVCKLRKALYGLKHAPRAWYLELKGYLVHAGFKNSMSDTSLFILQQPCLLIYILVYVDDIVITGNNSSMVEQVIANRFSVKDMGDLSYFLGIEVLRTKGLHLNQKKYIHDLLAKMNMHDVKPVTTPITPSSKLTKLGDIHSNPKEYRTLVGSLQYLAFTRVDIAYAVNKLSQFMHAPMSEHWQAAKRVLRYLAGTSTHDFYFKRNDSLSLHAYSDADWAGDTNDLVSTNDYIVYLGS